MDEPRFEQPREPDLPRTFLRDREAMQQRARDGRGPNAMSAGEAKMAHYRSDDPPGGPRVTVSAFEVPFMRLMWFLIKVALAALPALLILGLMMFAIGQVAQAYLPWLVKMRIVVTFP